MRDYLYSLFLTSPTYLRDTLLFFIWLFFAMALGQLIFLITHKIIMERREQRFKQRKLFYFSCMLRRISQPGLAIKKPADKLEMKALIDVCVDIMSSTPQQNVPVIHEVAREHQLPEFLLQNFNKFQSWITRYQVMEILGFMKLPEMAPFYREMISRESAGLEKNRAVEAAKGEYRIAELKTTESKHLHLISKALWALSHICADEDFATAVRVLQTPGFMSGKYNEYIFCNIIRAYVSRKEESRLLELAGGMLVDDSVPMLIRRDFIQACGISGFTESHRLVRMCIERISESAEMKMACIRTLEKLGGDNLEEIITGFLSDPDWRVRAVAAKDAHLCSDGILPFLRRMLCDQSYHVRLNAALSMANKGEAGRALLLECASSGDRYENDMAQYALKLA